MPIKLTALVTCALDTDAQTKQFDGSKVWFEAIIPFKRCVFSVGVNQPIVQVDQMKESSRPIFCSQAQAKEECAHPYCEYVIIDLYSTIL